MRITALGRGRDAVPKRIHDVFDALTAQSRVERKREGALAVLLHETLGPEWMTPERFRIGASTLLNDVLMQIQKERSGRYQGPDYFTID